MAGRRTVLAGLAAAAGASVAACTAPQRATAAAPCTVNPSPNGNILISCLGDSITAGFTQDTANGIAPGSPGLTGGNGYRAYLLNNLYGPNETHTVQMVGTQWCGTAGLRHEGHPGWTVGTGIPGSPGSLIDLVRGGVLDNPPLANAGPPQIVILQCGANDFGAGRSWQQVLADTSTLLDLILALPSAPNVVLCEQILMSGSISHTLTDNTRRQQGYNAALPGLIASKAAGRVVLAHTSRLRQQDLDPGGVHPTDGGYRRMEWEIYYALAPWLGWDDGNGHQFMVNRPCPYDSRPLT